MLVLFGWTTFETNLHGLILKDVVLFLVAFPLDAVRTSVYCKKMCLLQLCISVFLMWQESANTNDNVKLAPSGHQKAFQSWRLWIPSWLEENDLCVNWKMPLKLMSVIKSSPSCFVVLKRSEQKDSALIISSDTGTLVLVDSAHSAQN